VRGVLVALAVLASGRAQGATVCGTLITNVVTATLSSGFPDYVLYEVSYNATATVRVLCPATLRFEKYVDWPEACAGTTVRFYVCVVNETNDSVWGATVTDRMPGNMSYVDRDGTWNDAVGDYYIPATPGSPPAYVRAWAGSVIPGMTAGDPPGGQLVPLYLRWTIDYVGPKRSACVTYRAVVL